MAKRSSGVGSWAITDANEATHQTAARGSTSERIAKSSEENPLIVRIWHPVRVVNLLADRQSWRGFFLALALHVGDIIDRPAQHRIEGSGDLGGVIGRVSIHAAESMADREPGGEVVGGGRG